MITLQRPSGNAKYMVCPVTNLKHPLGKDQVIGQLGPLQFVSLLLFAWNTHIQLYLSHERKLNAGGAMDCTSDTGRKNKTPRYNCLKRPFFL